MAIPNFPITPFIPQICTTLKESKSHALILTAETGAGKSTILPLGLLENFQGKILMTQPRRIAVLGIANRISDLLNEDCGDTTGYRIHLENKIGKNTRLEIITEAILVKIIQDNPTLDGYNLIILDEAHERSIQFDLALAFLKEAMLFRDDLFVIIMSATIDCTKISKFLNEAPILNIPGRTFPVDVIYNENISIENAIIQELYKNTKGDILVFLPGIGDIKKCNEKLADLISIQDQQKYNLEIHTLHSSVNIDQQRKILKPSPNSKRIILSSAISETSLTIPGVTTVIDSGLARISKININTGLQSLVTEPESQFSAEQRKGRAGREQPGKCIRLWHELDKRPKEIPPEILRTDLCELVLECTARGISSLTQIEWLDSPSIPEWNESLKLLQKFDFISSENTITPKGKAALSLGLHPRLANIAIEGYKFSNNSQKINELLIKYGNYEKSSIQIQNQFIQDLQNRLKKIDYSKFSPQINHPEIIILAGFPDRLAKRITNFNEFNSKTEFQFANGKKAIYINSPNSKKHLIPSTEWIVAPEVLSNNAEATIFDFEEINSSFVSEWINSHLETKILCKFENNKINKSEITCYDQIIISSKKLSATDSDFKLAWENEIQKKGISCLPIDSKTEEFLQRVKFYYQQTNNPLNLEQHLQNSVEEWLFPFITGTTLNSQTVYNGLFWFLDGNTIEKTVPLAMILENGSKAKIKYEMLASPQDKTKLVLRPVIEIIIQRIFGCHKTPKICEMNVLFKLLSPASRPLQITDDLENFWINSWPDICKEMKGRYPKHDWNPNKN